jgi:hypothetical protein
MLLAFLFWAVGLPRAVGRRPDTAIEKHSRLMRHAFVFAIPQGVGTTRDQNASIADGPSD